MSLPDTGVIVIGRHRGVFLSRTHFHVFGLFFPVAVPRVTDSVSLVLDLYRSVNLLTVYTAGPTTTGTDVIVTPGSRDREEVAMSKRQWPELFKEEAENLQR